MTALKFLFHILELLDTPKLQTSLGILSSLFPMKSLNSPFSQQVDASYQDEVMTLRASFLSDLYRNVTSPEWFSKSSKSKMGKLNLFSIKLYGNLY